jgi:LacI family transcriptional regulator
MSGTAKGITTIKRKRRAQRGPTLADVARHAGVSPMTVSRVVNREANVVAATRDKVLETIRVLGYVPNPAARNLAGARQCRIALLYSNPSAAYLSEFLLGSLTEASASDALLTLEHFEEGVSRKEIVAHLDTHGVNAVLLPPPLCDDPGLLKALHLSGLPIAQIATGRPSDLADAVTIDDEAAAYAMTRHLIDRGHARIGFIIGNTNQTASVLRLGGYERALRESGINLDRSLIAQGDFTYRSGMVATEKLLAGPVRPTAIFASNDDMAAAATAVAHRYHLNVPGDLSICGYDDTPIATTIWPELTTIRQPIQEMARLGTRLLVEAVRDGWANRPRRIRHEQLPFALIQRASDAPLARD